MGTYFSNTEFKSEKTVTLLRLVAFGMESECIWKYLGGKRDPYLVIWWVGDGKVVQGNWQVSIQSGWIENIGREAGLGLVGKMKLHTSYSKILEIMYSNQVLMQKKEIPKFKVSL